MLLGIPSVLQAASTSFPQVSEETGLRRDQFDGSGHGSVRVHASESRRSAAECVLWTRARARFGAARRVEQ